MDFLTSKSTNKNTRITIGNYEEYQSRATSSLTNEQPASNQPLTTYKNDKNEKNKEKTPSTVSVTEPATVSATQETNQPTDKPTKETVG